MSSISFYVPDAFLDLPHQNPFYDINNGITYVTPQGVTDEEILKQIKTIQRAFDKLRHRFDPTDRLGPESTLPQDYVEFLENFQQRKEDYWEGDFFQTFHEFALLFLKEQGKYFLGKEKVRTIFSPRSRVLRFFHRDSMQLQSPREKEIEVEQGQNAILYLGGFYQLSVSYLEYVEKTDQIKKIETALKTVIRLNPVDGNEERRSQLEVIQKACEVLKERFRKQEEEDLFKGFYRLAEEFSKDFTQKEVEDLLSPRSRLRSFTEIVNSPRIRQGVPVATPRRAKAAYFKSFYFLSDEYLSRLDQPHQRPASPADHKAQSEPISE